MKNLTAKRILSALLCLAMLVGILPASVLAVETSEPIYILAGSDFQNTSNDHSAGADGVTAILNAIKNTGNYDHFDGFLFAGDYDYGYDDPEAGKNALQTAVQTVYGTNMHEVYVEGNHDSKNFNLVASGVLSASGANDPASGDYGVFVINEQDYMWYNDEPATIEKTAASLDTYLTNKVNTGYNKPIFVVSHLPLHYSLRTQVGGNDGMYAKYIFDVLQAAGEKGLNIIFMYGHNHSHGWDDYLGGAAVYLEPGNNINIAKEGSTTEYTAEALKFTYMNAGFVSYYRDVNDGACTDLTMTVFVIDNGEVKVERYDANGQHNLKCAGVLNKSHWSSGRVGSCCSSLGTETYAADTSTVPEDTITLTTPTVPNIVWNTEQTVSVTAEGLTSVEAAQGNVDFNQNTYTVTYAITPMAGEEKYTGQATVALDLPDEFSGAKQSQLAATVDGDICTIVSWANGVLTLNVPHFSEVVVTYAAAAASTGTTYELVTSADQLDSGAEYLIIYGTGNQFVLQTTKNDGSRHGFDLAATGLTGMPLDTIEDQDFSEYEWTFTATGDQWYIGNGTQNAQFYWTNVENRTGLQLADQGTAFTITFNDKKKSNISGELDGNTRYWQHNDGGDLINGYASSPSGFYIYKKVANEVVENNHWYPIVEESAGSVYYELVTNGQISSGGKYLIVSGSSGSPYALTSGAGRIQVTVTDGKITTLSDSTAVFTLTGQDGSYYIQDTSGTYLFPNTTSSSNYSISSKQSDAQLVTFTASGQAFQISRRVSNRTAYLRHSNYNGFSASKNQSNLYLFRQVQDEPEAAEFAMLKGQTSFTYLTGQITTAGMRQDLAEKLEVYTNTTNTGDGTRLTQAEMGEYVYANTSFIDPSTPGTYIVNVTYKDVPIGAISVTIADRQVTSIVANAMEGTIARGATYVPDVTLTVTYDDGNVEEVPLRTRYLSGTGLNTNANGTYENLTITYGGKTLPGFTLHVENVVGNDFPDYPDPGSVSVNKTATGIDFQNTGLTRVELSTSGLPAGKGVDVVVVVDTSSSMDDEVEGQYRIDVLRESLRQMLKRFTEVNSTTGVQPDIDVAVISFNGYANTINGATLDGTYRVNPGSASTDHSAVFTGPKAGQEISNLFNQGYVLSAADFVNNQDADFNPDTIANNFTVANLKSGTNYDAAMGNAYNLLKAKKDSNTETREQYVIFLSDGAPFRYNGFNQAGGSTMGAYDEWAKWLDGAWADDDALKNDETAWGTNVATTYSYFYNGNGTNHPHRIAEAIKGTPGAMYDVVDPQAGENTPAYISQWEGLGAKIYSIGFCLADDYDVTEAIEKELIEVISSGAGYAFPDVTSADQLDAVFNQIAESISYAAQGAFFEDKMGSQFELQMNPTVDVSDGSTTEVNTDITIKTYPVYTKAQIGTVVNNHTVTADDVGKTYGDGTVIEKVRFVYNEKTQALQAFSSVKGDTVNILVNGIINAEYFWYNTTSTPNNITLDDGSTYVLPSEAFRWDIGIINEQQFVLSYVLKLSDALSFPGVPAGSYATNEYAKLTYVNWLGNTVTQDTVSPEMAWEAAQVQYGFYLVDENGNPLMANGEKAENFLTAYKVTNPILHEIVELNTGDEVAVIDLNTNELLRLGYDVYDSNATYTITIKSGEGGGNWVITTGDGKAATTYVTNYATAYDYTKLNSADVTDVTIDYTNTIVWFAVVWTVGAVNDTVVVDYGLPVDISVMVNDMFGAHDHYELTHVGPVGSIPADGTALSNTVADGFVTTMDTGYGKVEIRPNEVVRYTPGGMQMNGADTFAYAVQYKGNGSADADGLGYYYGTVTVIPATSIYYEDSFITFTDLNYDGTPAAKGSVWSQVGETVDATQSEDRPGTYSLSTSDANNIYGFDPAYKNFQQFSLGSAMKAHVVEQLLSAKAEFTFTGTGFDIISMTSNMTGNIILRVKGDNGYQKFFTVDTYYGYSYDEASGTWVVNNDAANSLYQIPVMKVENLSHGTYTVTLSATYNDAFNHGQYGQDKAATNNSYDIYLDAVRIYNPVDISGDQNQVVEDAYVTDKEGWPTYQELRNILITQEKLSSNENVTNAAVFIDGSDGHNVTIAEYTSYGPNNEVYLKGGQLVVFRLEGAELDNVASVQVGLKSADGKAVNAEISNVNQNGALGDTKTVQLTTSTEMFYDISALRSGAIMIANPAAAGKDSGILSITSIKITYKEDPDGQIATLSIDEETAGWGVMALCLAYEPEEEIPAEPEYFQPETFEVKLNKTAVMAGSSARLTVTTSADVDYLTVNGEEVTTYRTNRRTGERSWTVTVKAETAGELPVEVIAYSADGLASEPVVETITVNEVPKVEEVIKSILGWIFGRR